jgi:putative toxin-antitoxin system antitoxin component (TIGR02293 family)
MLMYSAWFDIREDMSDVGSRGASADGESGPPIRQLQADLGLDERGLAMALGVDKRTLSRWISGDNYPQREARKRLQALVQLHHALLLMWRDMDAARTWLHRPSPYLGHTEPIELVRAGRYDRVEAALEAINSGFAS